MSRLSIAFKALRELGPWQVGQFVLYRLGLRTGWLRQLTRHAPKMGAGSQGDLIQSLLELPDPQQVISAITTENLQGLWTEADEIVDGKVRLFGGPAAILQLSVPGPLAHWTAYETGRKIPDVEDIKFIWEPGRFGWAYTLGRAYWLSGEERYSQAFWCYTETFLDENPPYLGPHWSSAQEVALRLIAMVFAAQVFSASHHSTPDRRTRLAQAMAEHAARIPPTLAYARAQNNNHLLSEAAGLFTAGIALPGHPQSRRWRALGWKWFNRGLQSQIDQDGAYMQHSANYHRLMLQLSLWMDTISGKPGQRLPAASRTKLEKATLWLFRLLDHTSGQVPNLGPNDGAYIIPLTVLPFKDFRPVLQAAGHAFLGQLLLEHGPWDEMTSWLPCNQDTTVATQGQAVQEHPVRVELPGADSWAYLRAASFNNRPGHADQLHLDLWWRGLNLAQDAGTYLYNGRPPWENALAKTSVHNTITLDGQEQMTWAGRFLWLDWSQATILNGEKNPQGAWNSLTVSHNGYRERGCLHRRRVTAGNHEWLVEDHLLSVNQSKSAFKIPHIAQLHWLLPDWTWDLDLPADEYRWTLRLKSPYGWISLAISAEGNQTGDSLQLDLVRAGKRLFGSHIPNPTWGWVSPTYGVKSPALSVSCLLVGVLPIRLTSRWNLPSER